VEKISITQPILWDKILNKIILSSKIGGALPGDKEDIFILKLPTLVVSVDRHPQQIYELSFSSKKILKFFFINFIENKVILNFF
jgi:hypothetical protein